MSDDTRGSASEMRRSDLAGADLDNYYIEKKRYAIYFYLNVLYSINKLLEDVWAKAVISFSLLQPSSQPLSKQSIFYIANVP